MIPALALIPILAGNEGEPMTGSNWPQNCGFAGMLIGAVICCARCSATLSPLGYVRFYRCGIAGGAGVRAVYGCPGAIDGIGDIYRRDITG